MWWAGLITGAGVGAVMGAALMLAGMIVLGGRAGRKTWSGGVQRYSRNDEPGDETGGDIWIP